MTRFSADLFSFELPGEDWAELTVQMYRPEDSESSMFMITRAERSDRAPDELERVLRSLPKLQNVEIEVLRSQPTTAGNLEGYQVGIRTRTRKSADYMRFLTVHYYEIELNLCWGGPASDQAAIDARAERSIESLRFRRR